MCSNCRQKAHNSSYESMCSPLCVEPKKQTQASRLQPPALAKLSAFGWSGSARFGARYWIRMLFWANRGRSSLTRTYTDLVAPITRHRHHHNRELADVVMKTLMMKYADDSALLKIIKRVADRSRSVEEVKSDLEAIANWGRKWKVKFEPKKTHAMLITRKKPVIQMPVMDGKGIAYVSSMNSWVSQLTANSIGGKWRVLLPPEGGACVYMLGAMHRLQSVLKPMQ